MTVRELELVVLQLDVDLLHPVFSAGHVDLLSKWPMLPTIALSFIRAMCSTVMMLKLPLR